MKKFAVLLEDGEDGCVVASVPQLPGCVSQGRNREDALRNIKEAITLYLECVTAHPESRPRGELVEVAL